MLGEKVGKSPTKDQFLVKCTLNQMEDAGVGQFFLIPTFLEETKLQIARLQEALQEALEQMQQGIGDPSDENPESPQQVFLILLPAMMLENLRIPSLITG